MEGVEEVTAHKRNGGRRSDFKWFFKRTVCVAAIYREEVKIRVKETHIDEGEAWQGTPNATQKDIPA